MTALPLIHIGYHKTGTTWLQQRLFQPRYGFQPLADHAEIWERIVAPHGLEDGLEDGAGPTALARAAAAVSEGQAGVLSSEIMVGNPFFGGRESEVIAERLKALFGEARILVTIRAQAEILLSTYAQYITRGGTMTASQFFAGDPDIGYFGFNFDHFRYDRLVGRYQALFGAENVLVLPQEWMARDLTAFCAAIADFAGVAGFQDLAPEDTARRGVSYPEYTLSLQRRVNHVRASTLNPNPIVCLSRRGGQDLLYRLAGRLPALGPLRKVSRRMFSLKPVVTPLATGRYGASNRRLRDMVRQPLDLTGYDLD